MQLPDELQPALWGALCGAAAVAIVGFSWGGWVTSSTSETLAKQNVTIAYEDAEQFTRTITREGERFKQVVPQLDVKN